MVLLLGSNGQLGYDFQRLFNSLNIKYEATDYKELNILNKKNLEKILKKKISIIINCAAYNNVDKAENNQKLCYALNSMATKELAKIAKKLGIIYVTYSTDFVFDGQKHTPYFEEDRPNPLSVYGKSKYDGEMNVLKMYDKVYVIRTSWVFGIANNNFNKQIINWSKSRNELDIVDDQVSVPTYSRDLADFSWKLIQTNEYGLYHISNNGECSKYEQAKYILEKIGWLGNIRKVKTNDFNLLAKRPKYSKLSSNKIEKLLGEKMLDWKDGIDRFLDEMKDRGEI